MRPGIEARSRASDRGAEQRRPDESGGQPGPSVSTIPMAIATMKVTVARVARAGARPRGDVRIAILQVLAEHPCTATRSCRR
jgi:hypothetical protein